MDPKKQELNPELKEIYNRVMNTQVKSEGQPQSAPSQPPPAAPQAPKTPPSPAGQSPPGGATDTTNQDPFFSSAPPRPMVNTKPFVFTGNKVTTPQEPHSTQLQTTLASSKKLSGPIIAVLVVILIVIWSLFWAKFFGLF